VEDQARGLSYWASPLVKCKMDPNWWRPTDVIDYSQIVTEFVVAHKPLRYIVEGSIIVWRRIYQEV
jgi:hypothetical protein